MLDQNTNPNQIVLKSLNNTSKKYLRKLNKKKDQD